MTFTTPLIFTSTTQENSSAGTSQSGALRLIVAALEKVRDPYGDGPFELRLSDSQAKLVSKLCGGSTVINQTFTLPTSKQKKLT
ncbi:MAG: hypothetical protein ABSF26_28795 [Thermoguttaceae bacterium]|jgi:hypothetical protein